MKITGYGSEPAVVADLDTYGKNITAASY